MRNVDLNYINVIDIEATCWGSSPPEGVKQDIIEIGIAELCRSSGKTKSESILVIPERSTISEYCTNLTTLTQKMIEDKGVPFSKACKLLMDRFSSRKRVWASFGNFDRTIFRRQCKEMNVPYPFGATHLNVKTLFALVVGIQKEAGMKRAMNLLRIPLVGTHHRGVDDARNIAKILRWTLNERHNTLPQR